MSVRRIKIRSNKKKTASQWIAAGAMVATAAINTKPALAQQTTGASAGASQAQTLAVAEFDIPAGPLAQVIDAFVNATGSQVKFAEEGLRTIGSPGVRGQYTREMALRELLEGTMVNYRISANGRIVLQVAPAAFGIEVTDTVVPEPSSPRLTSSLRDLPQTVSIIPRSVIEQQGATSLRDVLRNVPGLTMTAGEGGVAAGDNLTIRGNNARNDIFIDGSRDISTQSRDPFGMEQVEVTKGPASVNGRGSAGGTINLVSKAPTATRGISGSFAAGNAEQRRGTLDLNTPAHILGDRTGFRLNLLWHESGVPGRDAVRNNRWGFQPALTFGMGTPTRLTLQHYKLKQDNISDYGIPWVPATNNALAAFRDRPAPVPRETFYGFRDRDKEYLNQDSSTVRFEHDFSDNFTFRNQLRYGRAGRNSIVSPPRFANTETTVINRGLTSWVAHDRVWDNQTDVRANFNTGFLQHTANFGAAFLRENNVRFTRSGVVSQTTLLNPDPDAVYTGPITIGPNRGDITGTTQSLWAFDTARFGEHFEASGGARWERFDADGVNTNAAAVRQTVKMTSVRAGLTYKPIRAVSVYGSYGTSLTPSLDGLSYSTSNTAIPPEKTYTTEAGAKWDTFSGRMLVSGAWFRVAKDNARTPGLLPTDPPQVLAGQQVSKGMELSATGAITRQIRILGAYTFIDAKINESNTPAEVGKYFQNTPRHSASLWATYTRDRFSFGVGPRVMGERFGNNTNTRRVDGYWTMDAMASVAINEHLDLRLNLTNLNDAYYFDRLGGGHLIPGQGLGALVTTYFRF